MKCRMLMFTVLLATLLLGTEATVWAFGDPGIADTLRIVSVQTNAGEGAVVEVHLYNDEEISALSILLGWDSPDIVLDSCVFGGRFAVSDTLLATIENDSQRVIVRVTRFVQRPLEAGNGVAMRLYFNIPPSTADQIITIDETSILGEDEEGMPTLIIMIFTGMDDSNWFPQMVPGTITIGGGAVGDDEPGVPSVSGLSQNYPNPFNPSTIIKYNLERSTQVSISIFNILGQEVRNLVNESRPAGENTAVWNGRDNSGSEVASGVYFYRIHSSVLDETRKMILMR